MNCFWHLLFVWLGLSVGAGAEQQQVEGRGALSRAHSTLEGKESCQKCHDPDGKIDPERCLQCHQPIRQRMARKHGVHREVEGDCGVCHTEHQGIEADLRPIRASDFDHFQETSFPLDGAHAAAECSQCHRSRSYLTADPNCLSCHADGHAGALGKDCGTCHKATTFRNASRAFHNTGAFPLEGKHLGVACGSCHLKGVIKGTPNRCYDCHWVRRQDDRYRTALGTQCENCHSPVGWTAARWNHSAVALNSKHRALACDSCHRGLSFMAGEVRCDSCHLHDYQATQNPRHASAGFPTACDTCHRPSDPSFRGAVFNHGAVFPLPGAHATQPCSRCHVNNLYRGTPRDCYPCHQADYQKTVNPNHAAAGFPTACDTCHRASDLSFRGATFNHGAYYQLLGAHALQPCTACHGNNVYRGTPRECYPCHQVRYQQTRNPSHIAAGFPTTCEICHRASDAAWQAGRFNHTYFPIASGKHSGNPCSACHYDPTNFRAFNCLTCHDRARTDPKHRGITGYRYDSQACYSCHPQGKG